MARTVRDFQLETRAARHRLKPRGKLIGGLSRKVCISAIGSRAGVVACL